MKAKFISDFLNEGFTEDNYKADKKLDQYYSSKNDYNPSLTKQYYHKIIDDIKENGYYIFEISPRWEEEDIEYLEKRLSYEGIRYDIIRDQNLKYGEGLKIYNIKKDPKLSDLIYDVIQDFDPANNMTFKKELYN